MNRLSISITFLAIYSTTSIGSAETIHVPGDYTTIQAGINAAMNSDTVLVADGIYNGDGNRDIDFHGKSIVVVSENGPAVTIVVCGGSEQHPHRGFIFRSGEDSTSVLRGFTILNGVAHGNLWPNNSGGAILCKANSSPTIMANVIMDNQANFGGGITCASSSPILVDNTIMWNETDFGGGGIYCFSSSPTIKDNTINGNTAGGEGGGIDCYQYSSPDILANIITENTSNRGGGGVVCGLDSHPTIHGNTITENVADYGGGIYSYWGSSPTIVRSTIAGNTADSGGGIYCYESSSTISTCILWGDSPDEIYIESGDPIFTYSNIQGGWSGEGNIDADPMFVLPDKGEYRLLWESPCIDTGHPDSLDADGTRSDMGAHYFNQLDYLTLYVTPDTTEVAPGGQLGVTYTAINRWEQPESFWVLSQVLLPGGSALNVLGPDQYTLPANYTAQVHIAHPVPNLTPIGVYEYQSLIGMPPGTLYDDDSFKFLVF